MDPLDFTGKAVVVTGGTRGIGAAIAAAFRDAGADVLVCVRTPPEPAGDDFLRADVRDPEQAAALIAEAVARFGRLVHRSAGAAAESRSADGSGGCVDGVTQSGAVPL